MNELPTSAMGIMRQLATSKLGIAMFSNQLINSIKEGDVNPLELKAAFKAMEKIIEQVDEATKGYQLTEASKYAEQRFSAYGAEIEKCEVGVKYDYSACGDPIYNHRLSLFETDKVFLDERAAFLKALKEPITIVDDESGEVTTIRPPIKKSSEGLKFSFK
jgi:hypothetical protein